MTYKEYGVLSLIIQMEKKMKRLLIKFIKKVPFLYNIAKSINKKIKI